MSRFVPDRIAIVVRHYPGRGRLSGLVSFSRQLVRALSERASVTVFSGDAFATGDDMSGEVRIRVRFPFWLNVWWMLWTVRPARLIILSGIHQSRWLAVLAQLMCLSPLPARRRLFMQCVTLDRLPGTLALSLLTRSAGVAVLNPAEAARLHSRSHRVVAIPPGLDIDAIARGEIWPATSSFRIGFLGHLNRVKGADRIPAILAPLASDSDWDCMVCGSGEFADSLQEWAAHKPNVRTFGYLDDPLVALRSCDVLLAPFRQSATVLGVSQVVLEALALGIPVIGTPVEAIAQAVGHDREGLLAHSDEELSGYLLALMRDSDRREKLGANARIKAKEYTIAAVANAVMNAFPDAGMSANES